MKKTIAFIVLFFVAASLFSAYYYWSNSTISTSGTSTMGVKIEKTSDIINCGISSTFDSSKSDLGLTDVSTKSFVPDIDISSQEWSYKGKKQERFYYR